jgi:hypothetical protein
MVGEDRHCLGVLADESVGDAANSCAYLVGRQDSCEPSTEFPAGST